MNRLTWNKPNGEWGLVGVAEDEFKNVGSKIYAALCKLKDYEDTGLEPKQLYEMDETHKKTCKELERLKEAL